MKQNKVDTDETVIQKAKGTIRGERELDALVRQVIMNIKTKHDKDLDRISEDLTFSMIVLLIVSILVLVTLIFLIFVINRVGL